MIYYGENRMPDLCNRRCPFHFATALDLLMIMGVDPSRIDILAIGEYQNYKGEVIEQEPAPGEVIAEDTHIKLRIGYPSAVDWMPYQFFYGLQGRVERGAASWEESARSIMSPFDAAVIKREATARYLTLKHSFAFFEQDQIDRYLGLFDFAPEGGFEPAEALLWATLLPTYNAWAGNPRRVEQVLSNFYGYDFKIIENVRNEHPIPDSQQYRMGSRTGRLGRETVVGKVFAECDSTYEVVISSIGAREVRHFLPGRPLRNKLEWILGQCMPGNLDFRIRMNIEDRATRVGKDDPQARLGYASYLAATGR